MTPLERAARALCRLDGHPENATMDRKPLWADYLPEARAVLQAIREPSVSMLSAADRHDKRDASADAWRAMIDAALAEG
ncbi:hypothetical protein [Sphingopyxis witflariensis]|nr:hypothetical protein [Sphingopyxis witflariensis]